jgi:predicted RNase H-like nuclease (RuvC/YqgF family)
MSLNALRFGLNLTDNKKKHIKHLEDKLNDIQTEEKLKNELFPDCSHDKNVIMGLEKNLEVLKNNTEDISKIKEEKIRILSEKIHVLKSELFNKLSIGTKNYNDLNPLCSFLEIKK